MTPLMVVSKWDGFGKQKLMNLRNPHRRSRHMSRPLFAGSGSTLSPTTRWTGGPFVASNPAGCVTTLDPSCDTFALTINPPASGNYTVDIVVSTAAPNDDDYDVYVYGPGGARAGSSTNGGTPPEKVTLDNPAAGTY